jgi:hypothetical protein
LLKIPYLFSIAAYFKAKVSNQNPIYRSEDDLKYFTRNKTFTFGFDAHIGELALLFNSFQVWLKCDWISQSFIQHKKFTIFLINFLITKNDLRLKFAILGLCIYFRFGKRVS